MGLRAKLSEMIFLWEIVKTNEKSGHSEHNATTNQPSRWNSKISPLTVKAKKGTKASLSFSHSLVMELGFMAWKTMSRRQPQSMQSGVGFYLMPPEEQGRHSKKR